jgi:hypothetical protein
MLLITVPVESVTGAGKMKSVIDPSPEYVADDADDVKAIPAGLVKNAGLLVIV